MASNQNHVKKTSFNMVSNAENDQRTAEDIQLQRKHLYMDSTCFAGLVATTFKFGNPAQTIQNILNFFKNGFEYAPVFDWKKQPISKQVAVSVWVTGIYFLLKTYILERRVVDNAHKKYKAHNNHAVVAAHGIGSTLEMSIGCLACVYPENRIFTKISLALAVSNIITGFKLTPGVFGIKHLTVAGFYKYGVLRTIEVIRTLIHGSHNYTQAWILLQVGTLVRLLGHFVLPYTSTDGQRGDLFTEPSIYSFNILLSGFLTAMFVYPPKLVLASILLYVYWKRMVPPRISIRRRRSRYEGVDESYRNEKK